jgi:hypothetical protein
MLGQTQFNSLPIHVFFGKQLVLPLAVFLFFLLLSNLFLLHSEQSKSVFTFHYSSSYWFHVLLSPVSNSCWRSCRCTRKMANVCHFSHSSGNRSKSPVLVWWNCSTTRLPITSRTSSAAIEDRQVETRRWLVSILAVFQRKIDLELVAGKPSH